jgi:hypothetical protein
MQIPLTFQVNCFQVTFNLIFMNCFQVNHFMNCINASWIVLMQISSEPNDFFLTFQVNLIFMNCFQVNCATYKIQTRSYCVEEGENGEDLDGGGGGHEEGAGAQHGLGDSWGSSRRGVEVDTKEERACGVDQAAVGEAVGAVSRFLRRRSERAVWTRRTSGRWSVEVWKRTQRRSGRASGGGNDSSQG